MTRKLNNHFQKTMFNNLKDKNNKNYNIPKNKETNNKIFTINDILNNEFSLEYEKNAMMEMYTEIITVLVNQHFE